MAQQYKRLDKNDIRQLVYLRGSDRHVAIVYGYRRGPLVLKIVQEYGRQTVGRSRHEPP